MYRLYLTKFFTLLSKTIICHLNVKSYKGDICGRVFDEEENFKSHIESVHEGKKPYECDICGKVFDEEQNFKSHIETVHERKKP